MLSVFWYLGGLTNRNVNISANMSTDLLSIHKIPFILSWSRVSAPECTLFRRESPAYRQTSRRTSEFFRWFWALAKFCNMCVLLSFFRLSWISHFPALRFQITKSKTLMWFATISATAHQHLLRKHSCVLGFSRNNFENRSYPLWMPSPQQYSESKGWLSISRLHRKIG